MMDSMKVELLVVPDCPNESPMAELLRTALRDVGLDGVSVKRTLVSSQEQAERRHFTGSPTVLVDGIDPFPTAGPPSMACRIYLHTDGPSGLPELGALRRALKQAAARNLPTAGKP